METTTLNKKFYSATFENVQSTINKIEKYVQENEYQFKDRNGLKEINKLNINQFISIRKRKKLVNSMRAFEKHPTLQNINKFFHFLMKEILKSDSRIHVTLSAKEIAIQDKRKAYKEALAKVKAAYVDYKTEKGDFYKKKIN